LEEGKGGDNPLIYVVAFLFYFCNYAVIIYFNSALIACAVIRFKGGNPTLGDGIRAANAALPQILAWAVVAATVGLILKIIESANERAGQFVAGLLGMAWSAVTYFVVPSLVIARLGPIEAFKRSAAMLKRTWGEALTANFGIGLIFFIIFLFALIPLLAAMALIGAGANAGSTVLVVLGVLAVVVILVTISLISSALSTILQAAVYLYAAEGVVPQEMDDRMLRDAFSTRGQ